MIAAVVVVHQAAVAVFYVGGEVVAERLSQVGADDVLGAEAVRRVGGKEFGVTNAASAARSLGSGCVSLWTRGDRGRRGTLGCESPTYNNISTSLRCRAAHARTRWRADGPLSRESTYDAGCVDCDARA